jgi:hypothetical protein
MVKVFGQKHRFGLLQSVLSQSLKTWLVLMILSLDWTFQIEDKESSRVSIYSSAWVTILTPRGLDADILALRDKDGLRILVT